MGASASGIFTLLAILLAGPLYYGGMHFYRKRKGLPDPATVAPSNTSGIDDDERDIIDTSHYLFALIGYAIGIGNIWRFPYVIAQNGGCAALVAYVVCAVLVAVPLFLFEMIIGQHVKLSTIRCYEKIRPRWQSLGVASGCMLFLALCYYGMVVGYTLPYIWGSLKDPLPWIDDAEAFWFENVLNRPEDLTSIKGLGPIQAHLAASLIGFWVIVFLTVGFGRDILAKITYVTVLLPVFMIIVLVLRTAFLDGAKDGIKFYIGKFEVKYLWNVRTWAAACGQVLFSLSPGFGTAITYSSYAKPKEDVYRTCMIVAGCNFLFSIVAAFATFSVIGHLALEQGLSVEEVATRSGTGLAFITMAEAMQYFGKASNAMSVLFFTMLFLLGLDSAYAWEQTLTSYALDFCDNRGWGRMRRWKMSLACCVMSAFIGLIFTTRKGNPLLEIFDHFIASIFLLIVACMESIMINLDFTYPRLEFALAKATFNNPGTPDGRSLFPKLLCKFDLRVTVPAISGLLAGYLIIEDMMDVYEGYPKSLVAWGWTILALLFTISLATLWKRDPTGLESWDEEDIKINEPAPRSTNQEDMAPEIEVTGVV